MIFWYHVFNFTIFFKPYKIPIFTLLCLVSFKCTSHTIQSQADERSRCFYGLSQNSHARPDHPAFVHLCKLYIYRFRYSFQSRSYFLNVFPTSCQHFNNQAQKQSRPTPRVLGLKFRINSFRSGTRNLILFAVKSKRIDWSKKSKNLPKWKKKQKKLKIDLLVALLTTSFSLRSNSAWNNWNLFLSFFHWWQF